MNALVAIADTTPLVVGDSGLVRRFMAWIASAGVEERADAVSALARAYLYSDMSSQIRAEAVMALTAALDDASVVVRRALAEALASATEAPRHIVLALANDQSEVARVVLALSPLFEDAELVDCAAAGDSAAQIAIARRPRLGSAVVAALSEIGEVAAVIALLGNPSAEIGVAALKRMFERFRDEPSAREALLERPRLPAWMRAEIVCATAADLTRGDRRLAIPLEGHCGGHVSCRDLQRPAEDVLRVPRRSGHHQDLRVGSAVALGERRREDVLWRRRLVLDQGRCAFVSGDAYVLEDVRGQKEIFVVCVGIERCACANNQSSGSRGT